jgi:1-deoxy-D-xylulose-5-phosphate reductoisomerase
VPAVLSTADEMAVEAFLQHRIGFTDIPGIIADAMDRHAAAPDRPDRPDRPEPATLESIVAADRWTRAYCAKKLIAG